MPDNWKSIADAARPMVAQIMAAEIARVESCQSRGELAIARSELPDEPHVHEAARKLIREKGWECFPCGTSKRDWTDWTLVRLGWKLDEDRKSGKKLLEDWQRATAFGILGAAKRDGPGYTLPKDKLPHIKGILAAKLESAEALVE